MVLLHLYVLCHIQGTLDSQMFLLSQSKVDYFIFSILFLVIKLCTDFKDYSFFFFLNLLKPTCFCEDTRVGNKYICCLLNVLLYWIILPYMHWVRVFTTSMYWYLICYLKVLYDKRINDQWESKIWSCDLRANERPQKKLQTYGQTLQLLDRSGPRANSVKMKILLQKKLENFVHVWSASVFMQWASDFAPF